MLVATAVYGCKSRVATPYVPVAVIVAAVIGQIAAPDFAGWFQVLVNLGVAGYMLYWFSTRMEQRLGQMERSIDRQARAQLLTLAASPEATTPLRVEAQRMIAELEAKHPPRSSRELP